MTLPDFLILGAAKSGTTALYRLLQAHGEVFLPAFKEPFFFSKYAPAPNSIRSLEVYRELFAAARPGQRVGEASAGYLYCDAAPQAIRSTLGPDVRLIVSLRNPVDRAYSMYWHRRRDGEEPLPFREALAAEAQRIADGWQLGWHYMAMGHYRPQLERYVEAFGEENLLIVRFEELDANPEEVARAVTEHLGIAPFEELADASRANAGYTVRHAGLERLVRTLGGERLSAVRKLAPTSLRAAAKRGLRRLNRAAPGYPPLDAGHRRELLEEFRPDIEFLARRYSPEFQAWLEA